jgi:hypothetical protein
MIIKMQAEEFKSDKLIIVNFDGHQNEETGVTHHGGYVRVEQDTDSFYVVIINSAGDVVSETEIPFNFVEADI